MYVTINFLSCFNVDKAYLLDATWGVFELGLKVQAWHDGFCNNRKDTSCILHKERLIQSAPYGTGEGQVDFRKENGGWAVGGRLDKGGGTLRPQITSPLLLRTTFYRS